MGDAMVTGRMSIEKKDAGARVLAKAGLNASQAINLLYERLVEEQSADFLVSRKPQQREWASAAKFIDSLASPIPIKTRFDNMTRGQIKRERAESRGRA